MHHTLQWLLWSFSISLIVLVSALSWRWIKDSVEGGLVDHFGPSAWLVSNW